MTDEPFRPEAEVTPGLPGAFPSGSAARRGRRAERRRGRRRRITLGVVIIVVVVVAVALVAWPGGNSRSTKTTSRRSTPTSASSTTSTSAVTATTLIPRSSNPAVALAQQYDGRYVGMFTNTTFQTTGPATLDLRIDPNSGVLTASVDLNGDLFGGGAKQVRRIDATVTLGGSNPSLATRTSAFGPVTGKLGNGFSIVFTAPSVPDAKVNTFELTGTLRSDTRGFDATFTVGFRDGRSAQGTVTVLCAPQGQRPSQVTTVCGLM
ncbi:MAG TPA: hypothetical protein VIJ44_06520 [Acidimicrobiia bacterium]